MVGKGFLDKNKDKENNEKGREVGHMVGGTKGRKEWNEVRRR